MSLFILGAPSPEMSAIESLLAEHGERIAYAVGADGERVHAGNAYNAAGYVFPSDPQGVHALGLEGCPATHRIECGWAGWERSDIVVMSLK